MSAPCGWEQGANRARVLNAARSHDNVLGCKYMLLCVFLHLAKIFYSSYMAVEKPYLVFDFIYHVKQV